MQKLSRFHACGSGLEYARGAMYATFDDPATSTEEVARRGVEAAAEFDDETGLPVISYFLYLKM
ncbi:MAG: hypothetical protein OHK0029_29630 [Armatimonadaceae bacterium]